MNTIERALYRGQDSNGKWVFGFYGSTDVYMDYPYHWITNKSGQHIIDPETVGQWTGLTDKNGVKIFEGDLLSHRFYNRPAVVSFSNGSFIAEDVCMLGSPVEVIGSIHSNPELLKGGK